MGLPALFRNWRQRERIQYWIDFSTPFDLNAVAIDHHLVFADGQQAISICNQRGHEPRIAVLFHGRQGGFPFVLVRARQTLHHRRQRVRWIGSASQRADQQHHQQRDCAAGQCWPEHRVIRAGDSKQGKK